MGQWSVAREFSNRALSTSPLDARVLYYRIMLEHQVGDFNQGEVYLERLQEVMAMTTPGPTLDTVMLAMAIRLSMATLTTAFLFMAPGTTTAC